MRAKLLAANNVETHALIFDVGDEVVRSLLSFARENGIGAAHLVGIGAFSDVVLGYFDWEEKAYERIPVGEQVEVLSLAGDIALGDGDPQLHAHVTVAKRDGSAYGGHLLEAHVRPTLEVMLTETPGHLRRRSDPATGLALIDLKEDGA
jgi:predicted DNA-binding protein with PD1-like motif